MFKKFTEKYFFPLIILFLGVYISIKNYVPGTFLLGWDNLAWEFNLKMNIARSFSAFWQEYQGVGLLGGMGHAADLPRQIYLLIVSSVLPLNMLR
jgi:hypothetical protein